MTEQAPSEPLRNPERLAAHNTTALQMRLFMGGDAVIYPPKELKSVTSESVSQEHDKNRMDTLKKLGITATAEGHTVWSQGEKGQMNHNRKVQTWAHEVDTLFKSEMTKPHQSALSTLSIGGISLSSINQETAIRLYERYFAKGGEVQTVTFGETTTYIPANVKRFVDDVIASHTENGSVNYSRLQSQLPSLTFLAGMFGTNTPLLLKDYLTAYIKYNKDASSQQSFLQEVTTNNRINLLTPQEDQRLKWFYETSMQRKVVKIEQKQQASARPAKPESTASVDQGLAQQAEPIVIEPKKDFEIEEKPKVFVIEPPEIPDYSKLSKDERLNNLPGDTLRSAQFFCDNLRKRMQEDGTAQPTKGRNGEDLLTIKDPVTKQMDMTVGKREYVENGCVFYDPLSSEGEQWRELAHQISLNDYIAKQLRQGKLAEDYIEIDGKRILQYKKPAVHSPNFSMEERITNKRELFDEWLNHVMPVQIHLNHIALDLLFNNRYDLTLENDLDFPDHIRQGKIQKVQFDGKNCVPISFFMNAVRYAAKPGDNEFKRKGIAKFLEDFGVRILTREEILGA